MFSRRSQMFPLSSGTQTVFKKRGYKRIRNKSYQSVAPGTDTSQQFSQWETLAQEAIPKPPETKTPAKPQPDEKLESRFGDASLIIQPPKYPHKAKNIGWEHVGSAPFRQAVVGASGSGKSVLVNHLMNEFYGGFFTRIYIFSPTFSSDPSYHPRRWQPSQVFARWDEATARAIYKQQRAAILKRTGHRKATSAARKRRREERARTNEWSRRLEYKPPGQANADDDSSEDDEDNSTELKVKPTGDHILYLIDDFASRRDVMHSQIMQDLAFHGRHYKISLIMLTQKYRAMLNSIRVNLTQSAYFRPSSMLEAKAIREEQGTPMLKAAEFNKMFAWVTSKSRHDFLWVNKETEDASQQYRRNLNQRIRIPLEEEIANTDESSLVTESATSSTTPSQSTPKEPTERVKLDNLTEDVNRHEEPAYQTVSNTSVE